MTAKWWETQLTKNRLVLRLINKLKTLRTIGRMLTPRAFLLKMSGTLFRRVLAPKLPSGALARNSSPCSSVASPTTRPRLRRLYLIRQSHTGLTVGTRVIPNSSIVSVETRAKRVRPLTNLLIVRKGTIKSMSYMMPETPTRVLPFRNCSRSLVTEAIGQIPLSSNLEMRISLSMVRLRWVKLALFTNETSLRYSEWLFKSGSWKFKIKMKCKWAQKLIEIQILTAN